MLRLAVSVFVDQPRVRITGVVEILVQADIRIAGGERDERVLRYGPHGADAILSGFHRMTGHRFSAELHHDLASDDPFPSKDPLPLNLG
jgi:hypothetical protein